ncbi:EthD domain-containing protein [Aquisediminimonas profunda]|uniref:EthD domain-containing protein n=1 Tax=Aquisediminimonas profunda TaxID=1550733 RepID=UPI001C62EE70|nr:EthD domain-containing protein [Aquisediminimonas profunda]
MIKVLAFLKKRPDMTAEQFKRQYENGHAVFSLEYIPNAKKYVRRYVEPVVKPLTGEVSAQDFDALTEIWFETREDYEKDFGRIAEPEIQKLFLEDEDKLFANHDHTIMIVVDECESAI